MSDLDARIAAEVARQLVEQERRRDKRTPEQRAAFDAEWRRTFWSDRERDDR